MNFTDELSWRGLLHQTAGNEVEDHIATPGRVAYCGFDPTADSLTVGNFLAIKMLMHWQRSGHQPIVVMGGGTGLIGDPSGKDSERTLQTFDQVEHNISLQRKIFEQLLDFDDSKNNHAILVNNYDWLKELSFIEALRDIGKHFSVNQMIQRDSVKDRLTNRDQGISYTEFSYMLLQAYDFLHLFQHHNCTVQVAGSDQYGNIVSGMDLIRRQCGTEAAPAHAFGITNKLVTKSDGTKIGKSAGNAVWLSADKTSPYRFYQFWLNTDDADVVKFLKWFTFLSETEINDLEHSHLESPHQRQAHRALAEHMTELVHGDSALNNAVSASEILFGKGDLDAVDERTLGELFEGVPSREESKQLLGSDQASIIGILVGCGLAESNSRAREFLNNGAVTVNGKKATMETVLSAEDLLHGHTILLRRGKKNWAVTRWV
ncbi:MAG: tyrosine--tRNA ligase [Pseudomonadota bacterium]